MDGVSVCVERGAKVKAADVTCKGNVMVALLVETLETLIRSQSSSVSVSSMMMSLPVGSRGRSMQVVALVVYEP